LEVSGFSQCFQKPFRHFAAFWAIEITTELLFVGMAVRAPPPAKPPSPRRTRLRPILMTSLAFIFGVAPLVVATGAGSEMRQSLDTAVFSGMVRRILGWRRASAD
jgi:hypothetical protein